MSQSKHEIKTKEGNLNVLININPIISTMMTTSSTHQNLFLDGIKETPLPTNWKAFTLDQCDESTNTDDHIDVYVTQVSPDTTDDTISCQVFPTSHKVERKSKWVYKDSSLSTSSTTKNYHIIWDFSCKFVKKIARKYLFLLCSLRILIGR